MSCSLLHRTFRRKSLESFKGHSSYCKIYTSKDTKEIESFTDFVKTINVEDYDSILSIGAGSGCREFLISLTTDNIKFYLEDLDTTCISKGKIDSIYLPHYSHIRGKPITNTFITVSGTDTSINLSCNSVNKVLIYNAYHHFTNDIAIVNECNRLLTKDGELIICEHVLSRNRKSYKFCDYGGYYKTEENFIKDIDDTGFLCKRVIRNGKYWRIFIFSKK